MVLGHVQRIAVQGGRQSFAKRHAHAQGGELLLPYQLPVQGVAVQTARTEEGVDVLAVRDGAVGGEAAVTIVVPLVRRGNRGDAFPEHFAGVAVQAQHDELVLDPGSGAAAGAAPLRLRSRFGCGTPGGHGGGDENFVAPDDGG
jgi:hypothetical protein